MMIITGKTTISIVLQQFIIIPTFEAIMGNVEFKLFIF